MSRAQARRRFSKTENAAVNRVPQWTGGMSFSLQSGVSQGPILLPVNAQGDSVTVTWIYPLPQPSWVQISNGTQPSIYFTGGQGDSSSVPAFTLQASANGTSAPSSSGSITVSSASSVLTFSYNGSEGLAIGPSGGGIFWQSAYGTIHGTLVEWGTGDHGHSRDNGVREYDPLAPLSSRQTYAFATSTYGGPEYTLNPGGPYYPNGATTVTQYDNFIYWYIPKLDSLVIPSRGQYHRATNTWPTSLRVEIRTGDVLVDTGNAQFDGGQLGWKNGVQVVGTSLPSVFYPGVNVTVGDGTLSDYNAHQAWSKQLDCGVRIAGGSGGEPPRPYMWIIAPARNFGVSSTPYYMYRKDMPSTVDGVQPWLSRGRDGCCFVGEYVYWVGGWKDRYPIPEIAEAYKWPSILLPYFFRMKITPHLFSTSESLTSGEGRIERLPDIPAAYLAQNPLAQPTYTYSNGQLSDFGPWNYGVDMGLLKHDPYVNALFFVSTPGMAMFDLRTMQWSIIPTPVDYSTVYAQYGMPAGCLGDFIDVRTDKVTGAKTTLRKFYWRPGKEPLGQASGSDLNVRINQFRSMKINRPVDPVVLTTVVAEQPNNPASTFNWSEGPKHTAMRCVGSGSTRRILNFGGDSNYTNPPGGGLPPGESFNGNAQQEMWELDISDTALSSSPLRWRMVQNGYHNYPWCTFNSVQGGYFGPGRPGGGSTPQRGPYIPDAYGWCIDKRGTHWMGPTGNDNSYIPGSWEIAGYEGALYVSRGALGYTPGSYMFQWVKPDVLTDAQYGGAVGVPLGGSADGSKGWKLPAQDRLYFAWTSQIGVDYEIQPSLPGANAFTYGYGRVNPGNTVYNKTTDRIYVMLAGGFADTSASQKKLMFRLYSMDVNPANLGSTGGKYTWTAHTVAELPMRQAGIDDAAVTGVNVGGDENRGCLMLAKTMIGTKIYFVFTVFLYVNDGSGNTYGNTGVRKHAVLCSIDVVTNAVTWIPFPESQPWWLRCWDGENANSSLAPLTPAQNRSLDVIGGSVVLGPDGYTKIGNDPWLQIYDTQKKTWTSFAPPSNHDWPCTSGAFAAVPELGEVWSLANQGPDPDTLAEVTALGIHNTTGLNAGRQIVRFKTGMYYGSDFLSVETPLSEGGIWINGGATGVRWKNVNTSNGIACASAFVGQSGVNYDDSIAIVDMEFSPNQFAQGTVYKATSGYNPGVTHEIELLLRFSITANDAHGYEVLWNTAGGMAAVRWNGVVDSFSDITPYGTFTGTPGIPALGDVLRAQIVGNVITVFKNDAQIFNVDIVTAAAALGGSVWTSGKPGVGFFPRVGATLTSFGWSDFRAGNM